MSEGLVRRLRGQHNSLKSAYLKELFSSAADTIEALRGERDHAAGNAARHLGLLNAAEAQVEALRDEVERLKLANIHPLMMRAEKAEQEAARLKAALEWALGEGDEWPERMHGEGAFYWRAELRRRAFGETT